VELFSGTKFVTNVDVKFDILLHLLQITSNAMDKMQYLGSGIFIDGNMSMLKTGITTSII